MANSIRPMIFAGKGKPGVIDVLRNYFAISKLCVAFALLALGFWKGTWIAMFIALPNLMTTDTLNTVRRDGNKWWGLYLPDSAIGLIHAAVMVLLYLGLRNPAFRQVSGVALMVLSAFLLLGGWYYAWTNRSVIQIFSAMMFPVGSVLWYLKVLDAQSAAIWFAACFVMLLLVVIYISSGSAARKIPPQANFNA